MNAGIRQGCALVALALFPTVTRAQQSDASAVFLVRQGTDTVAA